MKKLIAISAVALACGGASAQQVFANVVSVTPIVQQVSVPRQVCSNQTVVTPGQKTGAGAVMGAIAGGAIGNAVGGGNGRAATTALGVIGGAILGDRVEGPGTPQAQNVQSCTTEYVTENRISGYSVIYELGGKQYSVQMPRDPGPTLRVQLTPLSANTPTPVVVDSANAVTTTTVVYPATTVVAPVVYAPYYPYYGGPVVSVGLGWGFYGGGHHRWH